MTVGELIKKLLEYNLDADVTVIAHDKIFEFSLVFSGGDGVIKKNCNSVSFYVDDLNQLAEYKI